MLVAPDFKKDFVVQIDASSEGLGAVRSQEINREEHPVVFLSRKLTSAERNYAVVERECLAIKWALDSLRYFLLGRKFRLVSDHAPLTLMRQNKHTNARVTRWFLSLQEFNFVVEHRPGRQHQNADALSRVHCMVSTRCLQHLRVEAEGGDMYRTPGLGPGRVLYSTTIWAMVPLIAGRVFRGSPKVGEGFQVRVNPERTGSQFSLS